MMRRCFQTTGLFLLVFSAACSNGSGDRVNVLMPATDDHSVLIADFSNSIQLSPLEPGWQHETFFFVDPMTISFASIQGIDAIRLETDSSASILQRHVEIPLNEYPVLKWGWLLEKGIENEIDETLSEGDDSPARLIISLRLEDASVRRFEIIWAKQLTRGDKKYTHDFNHYVARGAGDDSGIWYQEALDIQQVYGEFWPDKRAAVMTEIALFSDTDDTDASTVAYYSRIESAKRN